MRKPSTVVSWIILLGLLMTGGLLVPSSGQNTEQRTAPALERLESLQRADREIAAVLSQLGTRTETLKTAYNELHQQCRGDFSSFESGSWDLLKKYSQDVFLLKKDMESTDNTVFPLIGKEIQWAHEVAEKGRNQARNQQERAYWVQRIEDIKKLRQQKEHLVIRVRNLIQEIDPDRLQLQFESEFQVSRIQGQMIKLETICELLDEFVQGASVAYINATEGEEKQSEAETTREEG